MGRRRRESHPSHFPESRDPRGAVLDDVGNCSTHSATGNILTKSADGNYEQYCSTALQATTKVALVLLGRWNHGIRRCGGDGLQRHRW
jgi:hypothetical protein